MPKNKKPEKKITSIGSRYIKTNEPIFNRTIHVFLNYPDKKFIEWARKNGDKNYSEGWDPNFAAFSQSISIENKPDEYIISIQKFDWTIIDQGSLIHEIVHTIFKIWKTNAIPFALDNQEFFAHSVANLYEDIAYKIRKKTA